MAFMFMPNGVRPEHWTPPGDGGDYEITPHLKPLEKFKDRATNPFYWRSSALTLKDSATVLWSKYMDWKCEASAYFDAGAVGAPPEGGGRWLTAAMLLGLATNTPAK